MARLLRWLLASLLLALLTGVALVLWGAIPLPPRYDPWAPLDIAEEPNFLTAYKLGRLEGDGPQCLAVLGRSDVAHARVADGPRGEGCGFENVVRVNRTSVAFNASFVVTCPMAVSWAMFETHVLQPTARRRLGHKVSRVNHLGSYACRNINHAESGRRSEHATANALDIGGFVLADGTRVSLVDDWGKDTRKGAFLRELRDGSCRFFDVVLGPDYNEAHRDHFHFDRGRFRACR